MRQRLASEINFFLSIDAKKFDCKEHEKNKIFFHHAKRICSDDLKELIF